MRHNIYEKGYGYIPRLIMEDRRLSALAKSIYAYFCSFSEGKASLFPAQDKILADLNMTEEVYRTHFQLLVIPLFQNISPYPHHEVPLPQNFLLMLQMAPY